MTNQPHNTQCDVNSTGYCETHGREYHKCQSNTQPDHIVDMHEMVTDTNQASEDELKAIIEWYVDRTAVLAKQDGTSFNNKHLLKLDMGTAIEALIRTEKLKLLAEVRERVIGEDVELNSFEIPIYEEEFVITSVTQQNNLRADQRIELDKLEAEL